MKKAFAATAALSTALSVFGTTYYVDCNLGDYTGHNGLTPETAFETIQQGIEKCAYAGGDEVVVYPGVYNKGLGRNYAEGAHWWRNTRIRVGDRDVLIRSTGGAAVTHIVGAHDPETVDGFGTNAVRCIDVEKNLTSTRKAIFEGFTIRDGSTADSVSCPGQGGAVMATSGSNEGNPNVYFVDCVISNCQGAASVFHGGTYVRCLIADNNFRKAPSASAVVVSCAGKFFNCVFTRNHSTGNAFFSGSGDANYSTFLNCSFVDNLAGFYSYTGMRWYNCLTSVSSWPNDGGIRTNSVKDTTATRMLMAPTLGDWRVRKGSAAENGGAMEYFADESIISLPSSVDRYRDFYGNPVDRSQTTLCLGAVQDVAVAAGGAIVGANANVTFDAPGRKLYDAAYVHPCVYPTNYLVGVNLAEGKRIRYFELAGHGTGERNYVCPSDRVDDRRWFIPPPDPEAVMTVNYRSAPVRYVDANTAVAEAEQDGSAERPFSTLQGAVDRLDLTDAVIVVKPGVYDKGYGVTSFDGGALMARSRVRVPETKSLRFVAEAGPEKTFIVGAPDPDNLNGDGCGDGATMTISIGNTQTFQGFTITGGYSPSGVTFGSGRGSIYSYGQDLHLVDCVITNNHGRNTALGTARFERCRIENNTGSKGLTMAGKFISCIIAGNAVTGDGAYVLDDHYNNVNGVDNGYWSTYALSCSVSGDGVHGLARGRSAHSKLVNSALDRGGHISVSDEHYASVYGSVLGGFSGYAFPGDYVTGDPMLIGGAQFDARTYVNSPVNTSAKSPAEDPSGVWWYLCTSDFYGNPWRYDAAGRPVAGAVQDSVTGGAYIGRGSGGLEIVSGAQFGYNDLEAGSSVTVKITDGAKRPLTGLLVNGVTNLIEKNASLLSGLTLECGDGVGNSVIPLYSPVNAWYVDAVNGDDDANFGYAPGCAWKTLERAFRNANLVAGDKVVAMPGVYGDGTMIQSGSAVVRARAVVPAGVTLESSAGSSVTFIRGEPAGTDDVSTSAAYNAAMKGLGKTAVRGVYLNGANSVVRGFTFTDCYTRGAGDAGGALHGNVDGCGAGVAGAGRAERCVFTGCHAFRGGGVYKASAVDCVFDGCHALYAGGASSDNRNYGCLTRNNVCTGNSQWGGFFYWNVCDNCTVLDSLGGPSGSAYPLRNALVVGKMGPWDWNKNNLMDDGHNFTNCFILAQSGSVAESYRRFIEAGTGCIVTNDASALVVDDDGRPVIGANLAVDAADETASENIGETDLSGAQRVYNGSRDAGALEADWRGIYGNDIRRRVVTVNEASENVFETEAKKVRIPSGEALSAEFNGSGRKYILIARMVGEGTLNISVDGDESVYAEGDIEHTVVLADGGSAVDISCEGGGYAEIVAVRGTGGMNLIVR